MFNGLFSPFNCVLGRNKFQGNLYCTTRTHFPYHFNILWSRIFFILLLGTDWYCHFELLIILLLDRFLLCLCSHAKVQAFPQPTKISVWIINWSFFTISSWSLSKSPTIEEPREYTILECWSNRYVSYFLNNLGMNYYLFPFSYLKLLSLLPSPPSLSNLHTHKILMSF